ncbi:hypothetical protein FACS189479_04360 [Spirochaetia bacterium]|nr:hypothetical protein FACS189479_04360 [Spirochaetia bacterium]
MVKFDHGNIQISKGDSCEFTMRLWGKRNDGSDYEFTPADFVALNITTFDGVNFYRVGLPIGVREEGGHNIYEFRFKLDNLTTAAFPLGNNKWTFTVFTDASLDPQGVPITGTYVVTPFWSVANFTVTPSAAHAFRPGPHGSSTDKIPSYPQIVGSGSDPAGYLAVEWIMRWADVDQWARDQIVIVKNNLEQKILDQSAEDRLYTDEQIAAAIAGDVIGYFEWGRVSSGIGFPTAGTLEGAKAFDFSTNTPYLFISGAWVSGSPLDLRHNAEIGIDFMLDGTDVGGHPLVGEGAKALWKFDEDAGTGEWEFIKDHVGVANVTGEFPELVNNSDPEHPVVMRDPEIAAETYRAMTAEQNLDDKFTQAVLLLDQAKLDKDKSAPYLSNLEFGWIPGTDYEIYHDHFTVHNGVTGLDEAPIDRQFPLADHTHSGFMSKADHDRLDSAFNDSVRDPTYDWTDATKNEVEATWKTRNPDGTDKPHTIPIPNATSAQTGLMPKSAMQDLYEAELDDLPPAKALMTRGPASLIDLLNAARANLKYLLEKQPFRWGDHSGASLWQWGRAGASNNVVWRAPVRGSHLLEKQPFLWGDHSGASLWQWGRAGASNNVVWRAPVRGSRPQWSRRSA